MWATALYPNENKTWWYVCYELFAILHFCLRTCSLSFFKNFNTNYALNLSYIHSALEIVTILGWTTEVQVSFQGISLTDFVPQSLGPTSGTAYLLQPTFLMGETSLTIVQMS